MNTEDEVEKLDDTINPDALESAVDGDFIEIEDDEIGEVIMIISDEEDLDIAFTDNDPRDWY